MTEAIAQEGDLDHQHSTAGNLVYQVGLGNEFETEAEPGTLPVGQNSPQKVAHGLVAELISGTTFTAPRAHNRRSYVYRIRPSVVHGKYERIDNGALRTPPFDLPPSPNHYSWGPVGETTSHHDFVEGLATLCGNGSPNSQSGMAVHLYSASKSMVDRVFVDADGELMVIPQKGTIGLFTEFGRLEVALGEVAVIPKGTKFRVELFDDHATGVVCENFGSPLQLPELGLIGTNGLANVSDFQIPVAAYEDIDDRPVEMIHKFGGNLWSASLEHSPLDVVAWRGSLYPYKYNLRRFVSMGPVSVDHPDPSIFTLLSSPSDPILGPNFDVMALTPRWLVAERTFRPPGFHRNCVGEFSIFLDGQFGKDLEPGSTALTNNWTPHGPGSGTVEMGRNADLSPQKIEDQLILLFESRFPMQITEFAHTTMPQVANHSDQWKGFENRFTS